MKRENSKLDESCTSNPKSETSNWDGNWLNHSPICDFGFEVQDSSNFEIPSFHSLCLLSLCPERRDVYCRSWARAPLRELNIARFPSWHAYSKIW